MAGDDGFPFTKGDGAEDLSDGGGCWHDEPVGDRIFGFGVQPAAIVDSANVGGDEAGADESDLDAIECEFGSDGVGESADSELAHGVGRSAGTGGPSGDAADEDEIASGFLDFGKRGVERAQKSEDVGFELTAIVGEREFRKRTDHAEARVSDDDVEFVVSTEGFGDDVLEVAVAGDVGGDDERSFVAGGGDFLGEGVEEFAAAGGEGEMSAGGSELEGEFFADAGGGTGDEAGFGAEERVEHGGDASTLADSFLSPLATNQRWSTWIRVNY